MNAVTDLKTAKGEKGPLLGLLYEARDLDKWYGLVRDLGNPSTAIVPLLALIVVVWYTDQRITTDLERAALVANAALASPLLNYEAARSFQAEEILKLIHRESTKVTKDLQAEIPGVFLQVLSHRDPLLLDTRTGRITRFTPEELPPLRSKASFGRWERGTPLRYVDRNLVGDRGWTLRSGFLGKSYSWRQTKAAVTTLIILTLLWLVTQFVRRYFDEAVRRRRFDHLVRSTLQLSRKTEEELINALPNFITHRLLDLDAAAVYLIEDGRIVPRSYSTTDPTVLEQFLRSADRTPLLITSGFPEAKVVRSRRSRITKEDRHPEKRHVSQKPYVISPIISHREEKVVGLLTAEKEPVPTKEDQERLDDLALLVAALLDDVRNAKKAKESHRKMIRMTRQVTLGTVVPVVAHNMRTPLSMIPPMVNDLTEKWSRFSEQEIEENLDVIRGGATTCLTLIRRIMDYSVMSKRRSLSPSVPDSLTDPAKVLETICSFFEKYLEILHVELDLDIAADFQPLIRLDELDFDQVITNLVINAEQAFPERNRTGKGYRIQVSFGPAPDSGWLEIRIKDNGEGVPPNLQKEIFQEGFTTKEDGTGVGLPYCKQVIENAAGSIRLEPVSERGACFLIRLPTVKG